MELALHLHSSLWTDLQAVLEGEEAMGIGFFKTTMIDAADAYLSRVTQRLQVINSNISNQETPGYKTKDVSFNATMQELMADNELALSRSEAGHKGLPIVPRRESQVFEVDGLEATRNENNVNLDNELLKLGDTSFRYNLMLEIVKGKIKSLQSVIKDA
jgi:flagellar basal-body rod protein FlgB